MPILAVVTAAAAAAVLITGAAASAAAAPKVVVAPKAAVRQSNDRNKAEVRFTTRLVRSDSASLEAKTPEAELVLAAPVLTTLDGQTASVNVTGSDPTYVISLSPLVEKAGDKGKDKPAAQAGAANKDVGTTLQVLWSIRLAGKTLPAGVSGVTVTGATRITADREEVIAEVILPDPKTGRVTRFRLVGKATVNRAGVPPSGTAR